MNTVHRRGAGLESCVFESLAALNLAHRFARLRPVGRLVPALALATLVLAGCSSLRPDPAAFRRIALKFEPVPVEGLPPGRPKPGWRLVKTIRYWPTADQPGATIDLYWGRSAESGAGIFAFLESNAGDLVLGYVGAFTPDLEINATAWKAIRIGRKVITMDGALGAAGGVFVVLGFDRARKEWNQLLRVDGGNAERVDLDGDGIDEIVQWYGVGNAVLYRWNGAQFERSDLGETLMKVFRTNYFVGGDTVAFMCGPLRKDGSIKPQRRYRYVHGALIEVQAKSRETAR